MLCVSPISHPDFQHLFPTFISSQDGKNLGQASILKMVDQADLGQYVSYPIDIVKFKKGQTPDPEDDNSLWSITFDPTDPQRLWWDSIRDFDATYSYNQDKCEWTDQCPSNAPSSVPSASPSTLAVSFVPMHIKHIVFSRLPKRANQLYFCLFPLYVAI